MDVAARATAGRLSADEDGTFEDIAGEDGCVRCLQGRIARCPVCPRLTGGVAAGVDGGSGFRYVAETGCNDIIIG